MTVLLLMPIAQHLGGAELTLKHLLRYSVDSDVEWHVVFFTAGPMVAEVERPGVTTYVVETGRLRQPIRFFGAVRRIAATARASNCQVVLGWSAKAQLYGSLVGAGTGLPSLWYQQGNPGGSHKSLIDRLASKLPARATLVVSEASERAQRALAPQRTTRVIYPGVELDEFDSADALTSETAKAELGLTSNRPVVGIVGRLQRWKGMHTLIEAMPRVLEAHPEVLCLVVGGRHDMEPGYEAFLRELVEKLALSESVQLCGQQQNVPLWMQAMDVVVHASDNEPFGLVVIEAMALGKPVVASDTGGPLEIITHGVDGLLTPFGDSDALAEAIVSLLAEPERASNMGQQAEIRARDFDVHSYTRNMLAAIRSTVAPELQ